MKKVLLTICLLLLVALPQSASAQIQIFDFNGYVSGLPGNIDLHALVFDPGAAGELPLPLDFANYQYTLVITGLTDMGGGAYGGGAIVLYEDALVGGTAADPLIPGTYVDGVAYLSGDVSLTRAPNFFQPWLSSITGTVDWTGGVHLNDLAPADQSGWAFLAAGNSNPAEPLPAGYDEQWDGKIETEGVVGTGESSWGGLKAEFRGR